ncbi:hypothetical protein JCGZ_02483 [Jatropha curcas]|uniref:Uncharacterized protein n=1 Tax=Jatropha curcas TaxID=180498 RepID=A0A067LDE6_JATCU|nr:hypothetical protein JCGZ_02483 [Jatropha curcas]
MAHLESYLKWRTSFHLSPSKGQTLKGAFQNQVIHSGTPGRPKYHIHSSIEVVPSGAPGKLYYVADLISPLTIQRTTSKKEHFRIKPSKVVHRVD